LNQQNKTSKKKSFKPTKNKQTKDSLKAFFNIFSQAINRNKKQKRKTLKNKKTIETKNKKNHREKQKSLVEIYNFYSWVLLFFIRVLFMFMVGGLFFLYSNL
jgi:lipopolysaccharide export LptBFGC system permease protein LptF